MKKCLHFLPNTITVLRIILTAAFIAILAEKLTQGFTVMPVRLYVIFVLICFSDFLDGAAARGFKAESVLGSILDIIADSLFIFSSLIILDIYRVMPVWFTAVVLADFLAFLVTSGFLARKKPVCAGRVFVFDKAGRIGAVIFYLIPAAACLAHAYPGCMYLLNGMIYLSVFLAGVSKLERFVSCLEVLKRQKAENNNG